MQDVIKAMGFLLLEVIAGVGMYCLWLNFSSQAEPSETPQDFVYRKLGFRSWSIKFLSVALVGTALMYYFQFLTSLELVCLGFGAFYLAMVFVEYFHDEDNVMAALKLVVPVTLFLNAYAPHVGFIVPALLVMVYDVQKNRADRDCRKIKKYQNEEK